MNKILSIALALASFAAMPLQAATVAVAIQTSATGGLATTRTNSGLLTTNTYTIRNNGKVFLHFLKTGAGSCTVTITTPGTIGGLAVADQTATVAATTGDTFVGPFPMSIYNDGAGDISFTISDTVGLSFAAVSL